jgi:hypothetical protein
MIASRARADMIDPAEAKDMTEPAEPAEATEKADPTEPIDPIEANEPTEPMESAEPLDAIERNESSDQSESELCEGAPSEARSKPFSAGGVKAPGRRRRSARRAPGEPPPTPRLAR